MYTQTNKCVDNTRRNKEREHKQRNSGFKIEDDFNRSRVKPTPIDGNN
jgi:hypothetical protein